jgi:D-beta-D-heptose 7-phosphate kinase/D-beta-D-heptose 1-phosphate adenosyltransferase
MKEYIEWFGHFNYDTARKKLKEYGWTWLVVTDGAEGVHVINQKENWHIKEDVREVADVTGAGDTFLAVLVYGYATKNMSIPESCQLACYASARNVEKRGVHPVTFDDLNRGVVWTNGVFDILHPGHLELLKYAKNLGKKLIVGINDDESVRRLKGNGRPVNNFATRKQQLEMLPWVDEVVVFGEDTPQQILEIIRPDIIVKGGDYTTETTVGNELAEVKIFPIVKGHSTTEIIGRIKE